MNPVAKFCCLLLGLTWSSYIHSQQIMSVVWPWNLGDADAQFSRSMMDSINRQQKQLNLVFENRPGAGASIAALHVTNHANSIMAASSAFFVRPNFFTEGVHDISAFRPVILMCSGPLLVASGKYRNWAEVPTDRSLTVGLAGPGTTSHLVADIIRQRYPLATVVPYRSTNEPLIDTIGQRVDFAVGFVSAAEQYIDTGKVWALGVTGPKPTRGIPTMSSLGFPNADRVVNHHSWLVPKNMPNSQFTALEELAKQAAQTKEVQNEFKKLHCDPRGLTGEAADKWFATQVIFWREISRRAMIPVQ